MEAMEAPRPRGLEAVTSAAVRLKLKPWSYRFKNLEIGSLTSTNIFQISTNLTNSASFKVNFIKIDQRCQTLLNVASVLPFICQDIE